MGAESAKLYLVATPIGNLSDITFRAIEVLGNVDLIAAEDTRHSRHLLKFYGISTPLTPLHEHNEDRASAALIKRLCEGQSIALISDAGTPLISDPGFPLVRAALEAGIATVPIPGPCALITALSASGLAVDNFCFEGFPPRGRAARRHFFEERLRYRGTLIFYESGNRVSACIADLQAIFPRQRRIVLARELTKIHEAFLRSTLENMGALLESQAQLKKGELVILLEGAGESGRDLPENREWDKTLRTVMEHCSLKDAAAVTAKLTGCSRKMLYQAALKIKAEQGG